jgi:hypothetical protein
MSGAEPGHIELAAHASALTEAIRAGKTVPAGRLLGLPELPGNDYWLDMAGATALTGIAPKTISSWLARGGPTRNPFPVPQRFLYRLYWRGTDIASWQTAEMTAGRRYLPEAREDQRERPDQAAPK